MEDAVYQEFLELERDHWWFQGRRAIFTDLLRRFLGEGYDPRRRLLDLGCGVGGMLGPMAEFGVTIGTDVEWRGLEHCRARDFPRLLACDGPRIPLRDAVLDCVTAFDSLEHIEDDRAALREIHRVLKPGGLLILSGPAYQFLYANQDRITHHFRRYTRGGLVRRAEATGYDVEQATYINFLLFPAILPAVLLIKLKEALAPPGDEAGSNVGIPIPHWLNASLSAIFRSEATLLRHFSAPAGHSVVLVARKRRV